LSNLCHDLHDLRQGLGQAASAAEIGALVHGAPGVYTPEDLGPYRYLLLCRGMVDERQQRLEALARYDQERGAKLFETLESWLDNKGNIVATSRALGVHQNTLRQRLARMEGILGFDLDGEDWLSMAMALKLVKLRLLHGAAREEQEEDRPACDPTGHRASRERALRSEPTDRIAWR
jgi:DNA-binding PucR family transcriptional regulator